MTQTLEAVFDGAIIQPDEPILLAPNTRVRIIIETLPEENSKPVSFLRAARSLQLKGPSDWATNLDNYLYGDENSRGS